jgi:hypothetical protein
MDLPGFFRRLLLGSAGFFRFLCSEGVSRTGVGSLDTLRPSHRNNGAGYQHHQNHQEYLVQLGPVDGGSPPAHTAVLILLSASTGTAAVWTCFLSHACFLSKKTFSALKEVPWRHQLYKDTPFRCQVKPTISLFLIMSAELLGRFNLLRSSGGCLALLCDQTDIH